MLLKLPDNKDREISNLRPLAPNKPETALRSSQGRNSLYASNHTYQTMLDRKQQADAVHASNMGDDVPPNDVTARFRHW
jgi:hypothetical protein